MQNCSGWKYRVNGLDECALPADEEGNYRRVIRTVRQDAQDNRRWLV